MVRHRTRKRRSGFFPLILGVWCAFFAAYSHLACDGKNNGGTDAGADVTDPEDAASDQSAAVDAPDDTTSGGDVGAFAGASGSYAPDDQGCGLPAFTLTVTNTIVANPFGDNGATTFNLKAGSQNVAEATGLIIFSQGDHTCSMTISGTSIQVACTNPGGGSCTEGFTKQ